MHTERTLFLREHSTAISDITTFDPVAAATPKRDRGPLVLSPIDTFQEDQIPPVRSSRGTRDSDQRRTAARTQSDHNNNVYAPRLREDKLDTFLRQYANEEDRIQRVVLRDRNLPGDRFNRVDRLQQRLERPQTRDRIEKAIQLERRRNEPNDLWDILRGDVNYDVSLGDSPPPPSIMKPRQSSSSESGTSYRQSEETLDFSDFDESSKTIGSQQRRESVRASTKADKELLDKLLNQDAQRPPLHFII